MSSSPRRWEHGHTDALLSPTPSEWPIVMLWRVVDELSREHASDYVLRVGVAHMIVGARRLLAGDLGRLDGGTLDGQLVDYAQRIELDLDVERFADGTEL